MRGGRADRRAALNVEGETIHSFFGFRPSLSQDLREYRAPRRLADVDLLIVDEVSMARADLVDMMDAALRPATRVRAAVRRCATS